MQNEINSNLEDISEVEEIVKKYFPELWKATEACLATVATLLLKNNANPTSLVLVGQASTGKTTVLDFLKDVDGITYRSDHFTPKSFVSHYADKKKNSLKDIDLLKRITQKCLTVPDLGVIFGKRREDVAENLGILTRALDGEGLSIDSGVHGQRKYIGDCLFAMLSATTPFGYSLWDAMGRFGSRLLFFHIANTKKEQDDIITDFKSDFSYKERKSLCRKIIGCFLEKLWEKTGGFRSVEWSDKELPEEVLRIIINLARLLTKLRGMIPKIWEDRYGDYQYQKPLIEDPKRAIALMLNIAKGRAILYGRNQINLDDIPLLIKITLSSCPEDRGKVIQEIIQRGGEMTTSDICELLNVSPKTALKIMENLKILGLVEYRKSNTNGAGRPENEIVLNEEIECWIEDSKFLELFSRIDVDVY